MRTRKRHGERKRKGKNWLKNKLAYTIVAFTLILICFLAYYHLNQLDQSLLDPTPKAAIIDHLSISQPNSDFAATATTILNKTGLPVDYYSGEEVTVDLYRDLPRHNYKVIIFRVHSTAECSVEDQPPFVVFFTSEEYSNMKYVSDQLATRVVYVNFPEPQQSTTGYFGITPTFIKESLNGRFNDTIIIAMGCDGLKYTSMAQAFIERGAKAYIGWNGSLTASHTDAATACLLNFFIADKQTIRDSVANTIKEVGPDPIDQSILRFHPEEAGGCTIPFYPTDMTRAIDR